MPPEKQTKEKLEPNEFAVRIGENYLVPGKKLKITKQGSKRYKFDLTLVFECPQEFEPPPDNEKNKLDPGDAYMVAFKEGEVPEQSLVNPRLHFSSNGRDVILEFRMEVPDAQLVKRQSGI
jgi:hypothetical protein